MKKLLVCLALILALALVFASCNKDKQNNEETTASTTEAVTEAPTTEETTTSALTEAPTTADTTASDTTAEETTTAEITTAEETTTVEITTAEETTTVEITTAEETTTVEITTAEETTTAEITTVEETTVEETTVEETTVEQTTEPETSADETTAADEETSATHDCQDDDYDHLCDTCGDKLTECDDSDNDHLCDYCYAELTFCADEDKNHLCDSCGYRLGYCADENGDDLCDVCGAFLGVNEWETRTAYASAQMDVSDGYKGQGLNESAIPYCVLTMGGGVVAGSGDQIKVTSDGQAVWQLGGFAAWYEAPTGKYVYDINFVFCENGASAAFVRGWAEGFIGWDADYYGAAGKASGEGAIHESKAHGKAGIYYNVRDDVLVLTIKSWDDLNNQFPLITEIKIPGVTGKITVVDLNEAIYFLNEGKTVAKVELVGSTYYGEITAPMTEKIIVHSWDGKTYEVENALVAADMLQSEFGISNRTGAAQISEVGYGSAKDVAVNDTLDSPTILSVTPLHLEGDLIIVEAAGTQAAYVGLYSGDTLVMYYELGACEGFIANGENITVVDESFAAIPAGKYDVKLLDADYNALIVKSISVSSENVPVVFWDAEALMNATNTIESMLARTFGTKIDIADDKSYITLTMDESDQGKDYNWFICWPGAYTVSGTSYFALRYKTTADANAYGGLNEMYLGTQNHPFAQNVVFTGDVIADGEWHTLVVDLSRFEDMDKLQQFRLDLLNNCPDGSTIDVAWAGFFHSAEGAENYNG